MIRETSYRINYRRITPQARTSTIATLPSIATTSGVIGATVREYAQMVPSSVVLGMILLASICICATVISRTRTELRRSVSEYQRITSDVNAARRINAALQIDIARAQSDPNTIESLARVRLGMVRPGDLVVPAK